MPMGVDGDQCLLQEVLRLRGAMAYSCEAVPVVGPQIAAEPLQELVIRFSVAIQTGNHESSKLAFVKMSEFVHRYAAVLLERYAMLLTLLRLLRTTTF